jgi:hypothetical protein
LIELPIDKKAFNAIHMVCAYFNSSPIANRKKTLKITIVQQINVSTLVFIIDVITLTLGLRLKQGLTRVRAKKEAQESHLMPPGMQKSVRE